MSQFKIDYLTTDGRRFIQYNLWKNCNTGCKFCFNRGFAKSSILEQISILDFTIDKLLSSETDQYNEIGFIGGEFFDDQINDITVKRKFYQLFEICAQKYKSNKLKKLYIATSLVYDIKKHLLSFIKFIESLGISDIVLFCTSFDIKYRFTNIDKLKLWMSNMHQISSMLKNKIHVEMIVSQFFIDAVNNRKLDLVKFMSRYNAYVDYIEPTFIDYYSSRSESIIDLPDFFPRRLAFISFVKDMCIDKKIIDINSFLSIKLRSDTSYYMLATGKWIKIDDRWQNGIRRIDKYGNARKILSYVDSDKSMITDVEMIRNGIA